MQRRELRRIVRFVVVNGVGTVADISTVYVLHNLLHVFLLIAVMAGWTISATCGFALNRIFVFQETTVPLVRSSTRYLALVVLNLAVGVFGVTALVSAGWNYILTRILSSTLLVTVNFIVSHKWVFAVTPVPNVGSAAPPVPNVGSAAPPVPNVGSAAPPVPNVGSAAPPVPNEGGTPLDHDHPAETP